MEKELIKIKKATDSALRYLAYRARSRFEVVSKLTEQGYEKEVIDAVISETERFGYINDAKFCEAYIHDKAVLNGYGSERIRAGLLNMGVPVEIIDKYLAEAADETDETARACRLLEKRYKNGFNFEDDTNGFLAEKKKAVDFLLRKGYSFESAEEAFKQFLA